MGAGLLLASLAAVVVAAVSPARAAFEREWLDARRAVTVGAVEPWAARLLTVSVPERAGPRWSFLLSGGELFALREARGASAEAALQGARGRAEVGVSLFGSPLYMERVVALGVAHRASDSVVVGARARALGIAADGVPDAWALAVDGSVAARVAGRFVIGGRFENAGGARIGESPVASPAVLGAALALDGMTLEAGARVEEGFDAALLLSVEAALGGRLAVRAFADGGSGTFGLGLGVDAGRAPGARSGASAVAGRAGAGPSGPALDAAWWWHPELGVSSCVSVGFRR